MNVTVATKVTLLRILVTPFIVQAIMQMQWGIVLMLFFAAMMTDLLDGWLARRYHQESRLGQLLDPLADKTLIIASLYALQFTSLVDHFVQYGIWFLIAKEFVLLFGAAFLYYCCAIFIKPSKLSRLAGVSEMLLVFLLICCGYAQYQIPAMLLYVIVGVICLFSALLLVRYAGYIIQLCKR